MIPVVVDLGCAYRLVVDVADELVVPWVK